MAVENQTLAVVIPAYNAVLTIAALVDRIPSYVDWIIVVNDASQDNTQEVVEKIKNPRVFLINHEKNQGVGGAMITGFKKALEIHADLIAKLDADGQMDPRYLDRFALTAIRHQCDYVKANRFGHIEALPAMPRIRLAGNLLLTFLTKWASGYWNIFDPQNGYVMITRRMIRRLDFTKIDRSYFFENSMLINLNILRAQIGEIYIPAHYGRETSAMRIGRIITDFPIKLLRGYGYRIYQKYIFRSLSPFIFLFTFGILTSLWGCIWGGIAWWKSYLTGTPATTGTVILALLPLLLGWTALLQAFILDVQDAGPCLLFDYDDETLRQENGPAPD